MRIGYFDCFSGASGDMILGALLSAGVSLESLREELAKLKLDEYELSAREVRKQGLAAIKADVKTGVGRQHRHLGDIIGIIDSSGLSEPIKRRARTVFTRLAEAEAKVHGTSVDHVHFHEVGAVDAIVDVVGAVIGVELAGLEKIVCSPIPVGNGTVVCEHGTIPVPAPATAELLVGVPLAECDEVGELTTPTGAAILTSLAEDFGGLPAMKIERCGYGAGAREGRARPNVLRLIVGKAEVAGDQEDRIFVLETNLDDATGEQIGHAFAALFAAGALDVFTVPIMMKKNRPGILLSVLAAPEARPACEDVLFAETGTLGIRRYACARRKLEREVRTVQTRFGPIRMKLSRRDGGIVAASPEYEDCAEAAGKAGVGLRQVMDEASHAWRTARESGMP